MPPPQSAPRTTGAAPLAIIALGLTLAACSPGSDRYTEAQVTDFVDECRTWLDGLPETDVFPQRPAPGSYEAAIAGLMQWSSAIGHLNWIERRPDIDLVLRHSKLAKAADCYAPDQHGVTLSKWHTGFGSDRAVWWERQQIDGVEVYAYHLKSVQPGDETQSTVVMYHLTKGEAPNTIVRNQMSGSAAGMSIIEATYEYDAEAGALRIWRGATDRIEIDDDGQLLTSARRSCEEDDQICIDEKPFDVTRLTYDDRGNLIHRNYTLDGEEWDDSFEIRTNERGDWTERRFIQPKPPMPWESRHIIYRDEAATD